MYFLRLIIIGQGILIAECFHYQTKFSKFCKFRWRNVTVSNTFKVEFNVSLFKSHSRKPDQLRIRIQKLKMNILSLSFLFVLLFLE